MIFFDGLILDISTSLGGEWPILFSSKTSLSVIHDMYLVRIFQYKLKEIYQVAHLIDWRLCRPDVSKGCVTN